jgi:glycosyltransferase involved in cell wall biosynthesis
VERSSPRLNPARLDVSVIVPVRTAEAPVGEVVSALGGELTRLGKSWEVILVYDGVRGRAWQEGRALAERDGARIKTIELQHAFGESICLSAGLERAEGALILTSPHYVQCDPAELGAMLAALDQGADFVAPRRKPRIDPWLNRAQSALFNWLIRRIIHADFHDLNCYFRIMRREIPSEIPVYGDMYRFLPVMAHRQGYRVVEVPVRHLKEWGSAGWFGAGVYARRFLDILGVMFLTKFTHKPLRFFGSVGLSFMLPGAAILTVLLYQKLVGNHGLWGRPIFLVGVMLFVLGVQIIGFGLVGEIIVFTQSRNVREYRVERVWE